jgi:hypothetical protein
LKLPVFNPQSTTKGSAIPIRLEQLSRAAFAVIGEDDATNFGIVRGDDGAALLIDADIRRIDELEQALDKG